MQRGMREGVKVKRYREDTEKGGCLANFPSRGKFQKVQKGEGEVIFKEGILTPVSTMILFYARYITVIVKN